MALNMVVKIHPVVLFQIVDAYERRNADVDRVIGTLLGTSEKGGLEVTNCFCVPHKEYEEKVEADLNFAKDMYDLNKKVNPSENIIGWWATGNEVTSHSALIHDYYARETNNPIHLTVDTTLSSGKLIVKAYVCVPLGVPEMTTGSMFSSLPVETIYYDPEVVGVNLCQKTKFNMKRQVEPMSGLNQVSEATHKVELMLDTVLAYVEDVILGKVPADNQVGRLLLNMVNSVPKMTQQEFEEMLNSNMKDLLMTVYLAQLTKTQLSLNEKLSMLAV